MRQQFWIGVLAVLAGVAWGYFQTPGSISAQSAEETTSDATSRLAAPEIWRLPPVSGSSISAQWTIPEAPAFEAGSALSVPLAQMPAEPASPEEKAFSNSPYSLSGMLSSGVRVEPPPALPKIWEGSVNLGVDGSEGNTETMNIRLGCSGSRKTDFSVLTATLDYKRQTTATIPTADRLYFDGRCEWLVKDSRWSLFVHETFEYDQYQPFNCRDTSDAGFGFRFLKNDTTTLVGRLGGGFSHEYKGENDRIYIPEAVFGLQFEHQINKRQKLVGIVEYAPDVGDFLRYRIRTQAAWDLLLDTERNLSLRVGVIERYNSLPGDARPNDLDYALMLMWKF